MARVIPLSIIFEEPAWPDLDPNNVTLAEPMGVAILARGMGSGKPSVAFRIDLPDGKTVLAQTSARLFCTAARAVMARYPDLFDD